MLIYGVRQGAAIQGVPVGIRRSERRSLRDRCLRENRGRGEGGQRNGCRNGDGDLRIAAQIAGQTHLFEVRQHSEGHARRLPRSSSAGRPGSERELRAHRHGVKLRARIHDRRRRCQPGDVAMQIIEHETNVTVDVPVQRGGVDVLASPGDTER